MRRLLPFIIRRVHGHSMVPVLPPGTIIWGNAWFGRIGPGDVVVLARDGREIVKRIEKIEGKRVFVLGDHADASTDSRQFGWLPAKAIIAKVIYPRTPRL